MKLAGQTFTVVPEEIVPIVRGDKEYFLILRGGADIQIFESLVPDPKPPRKTLPGNIQVEETNDPKYKEAVATKNQLRLAWMIIKALEATPDLTWETVDLNDPSTWLNYQQELLAAGMTIKEVNRVIDATLAAYLLDDKKVDEAKKRFLASRHQQQESQ